MPVNILGVRIDTVTNGEALDKVATFLSEGKVHTIFTPNPEIIMEAQDDSYFREVLNSGDLNLCDGKGIEFTCRLLFSHNELERYMYFKRIAGIDFMKDVCAYAEQYNFSVYLLGSGFEEVIKKATYNLKKIFPKLNVVGYHPGPELVSTPNKKLKYKSADNENLITDIIQTQPDIIFVGFGHGKQEKWIHENMNKLPGVKIMMSVGGSFDILAGKLRRAPLFLRKLGLEWIWRLFEEPHRWRRVWVATVKFPMKFISERGKNSTQ
ncbi:MAG: WecB/TagA/CpsF family glycosyltransferase [bacterium]|nr:WecB/TagA/CpsF family glycosyltransferase [bacterium]